ncbi:hypothetical protein [Pedobacter sp. UBA5917]|jgi:hypothetical protein|uniref:hypothetical protein n=1 Tax=Pedobacter sp. UBA5917 TaxID=1947061 RepID=UPI0025E85B5A|nr:hypothetical protein [Pedobacter sp. UBA5917]
MKNVAYLLIFLLINSCTPSYYYGYVYDYDKKIPLDGVKIYDGHNKKQSTTNKRGYFELIKTKNSSSILIFEKEHYQNDTIPSISIQNGELMKERFKGEKIYLFSAKSTFRDSILKANNFR